MENEKESWYSNLNGRAISKNDFLSLYMRYHESMDDTLHRHFNVRNYYTVLLSALVGLYVGGVLQLEINNIPKSSIPYIVLTVLPSAILVLSVIASFSTTRYYTAWLRRVALVAKIENILGLDDQVKSNNRSPKKLIWRKDERFMDEYYWNERIKFKSSEEFIKKKELGGDNKWAVWTFIAFVGMGTFLLVFHLLYYVQILG